VRHKPFSWPQIRFPWGIARPDSGICLGHWSIRSCDEKSISLLNISILSQIIQKISRPNIINPCFIVFSIHPYLEHEPFAFVAARYLQVLDHLGER